MRDRHVGVAHLGAVEQRHQREPVERYRVSSGFDARGERPGVLVETDPDCHELLVGELEQPGQAAQPAARLLRHDVRRLVAEVMLDLRPGVLEDRAHLYLEARGSRESSDRRPAGADAADVVHRPVAEGARVVLAAPVDGVLEGHREPTLEDLGDAVHGVLEVSDHPEAEQIRDVPELLVAAVGPRQLRSEALPGLEAQGHGVDLELRLGLQPAGEVRAQRRAERPQGGHRVVVLPQNGGVVLDEGHDVRHPCSLLDPAQGPGRRRFR